MDIETTIPCPVCKEPILIKQLDLPTGDIARVYAEPLQANDNEVLFHKHQMGDIPLFTAH